MELLRIVSMMMVLAVHIDGASVGLPDVSSAFFSDRDVWRLAVESAVIVGVNCFTLISGYFGIRLRVRSVVSFLFQCVFYAVGVATLAWIVNPFRYGFQYWMESWMVLTHTDLWYVPAYFMLMLLSPMLNAGAERMERRDFVLLTLAFVVYNVWCGWMWGGRFNPTGYTVVQLVMVYMIGRSISMFRYSPSIRGAYVWFMVYVLAAMAVFASSVHLVSSMAFAYNSPFVLIESVALFMAFINIDFYSGIVNVIAKSAFAVYLVHKAPMIWDGWLKPFVVDRWESMSLAEFSVFALVAPVVIYMAVIPLDMVRQRLSAFLLGKVFKQKLLQREGRGL